MEQTDVDCRQASQTHTDQTFYNYYFLYKDTILTGAKPHLV